MLGEPGSILGRSGVQHLLWRPLPEEGCALGDSAGHGGRRRVGQVALERAPDALHRVGMRAVAGAVAELDLGVEEQPGLNRSAGVDDDLVEHHCQSRGLGMGRDQVLAEADEGGAVGAAGGLPPPGAAAHIDGAEEGAPLVLAVGQDPLPLPAAQRWRASGSPLATSRGRPARGPSASPAMPAAKLWIQRRTVRGWQSSHSAMASAGSPRAEHQIIRARRVTRPARSSASSSTRWRGATLAKTVEGRLLELASSGWKSSSPRGYFVSCPACRRGPILDKTFVQLLRRWRTPRGFLKSAGCVSAMVFGEI